MSIIKDIRLYRSLTGNIDGNTLPDDFSNKELNCVIHRIVMKLREKEFSLGNFDHLYINFTTSITEGIIVPASRSIDKYHPWYRFYDVGVCESFYNDLVSSSINDSVIQLVEQVLIQYFCPAKESSDMIQQCISEAVSNGEKMLMLFKTKHTKSNKAFIYLRYLNNTQYYPLIRVYDSEGELLLEKNLPKTQTLDPIGEIQLSSKKVTIKPRKNSFSKNAKAMVFPL